MDEASLLAFLGLKDASQLTRVVLEPMVPELRKKYWGASALERGIVKQIAQALISQKYPDLQSTFDAIVAPPESQENEMPGGTQLLDESFVKDEDLRTELQDRVYELHQKGAPYRLIRETVANEYGFNIGTSTISDWIRSMEEEDERDNAEARAEITRLRGELTKAIDDKKALIDLVKNEREKNLALAEREYTYRIRYQIALLGVPLTALIVFLAMRGLR